MKNYSISVAMATYNGEKYIKEQLHSILSQLGLNDEIIISDDGSTDQTKSIIESFHDDRIQLIDGPRCGLIQNFENAISKCHGKYIFLADQDDLWMDGKVDIVLDTFEREGCSVVVHDAEVFDSSTDLVLYPSFFKYRKSGSGVFKNIYKNTYIGCCMAFDASLKKHILPFPKRIPMHDQWIGIISDKFGRSVFIDSKLLRYRRHADNSSELHHGSILKMFVKRFNLIRSFVKVR